MDDIKAWVKSQLVPSVKHRSTVFVPAKKSSINLLPKSDDEENNVDGAGQQLLTLEETETITLLTITSCHDSEEESLASESGGQLDKPVAAETQTSKSSEKCKASLTTDVKLVSTFVNASAWDLYDTYAQIGGEDGLGIKEFQLLIDTALKSKGVIPLQAGSGSEFTKLPAEKQMRRITSMERFQYCVLATERLLASQTFRHKQTLCVDQNPTHLQQGVPASLAGSGTNNYSMGLLWTYDKQLPHSLPITALDWNPCNQMVLAAGYGRLKMQEPEEGCVCLWSPKNPSHPERCYPLPYSVTSISFSKIKPNILAVGSRSGHIFLIDVIKTDCEVPLPCAVNTIPDKFGPVWKLEFVRYENGEQLISVDHGGVLSSYHMDSRSTSEMLKLSYSISSNSEPNVADYTINTLSPLWFSLVPQQQSCYLSTKEGLLVKCRITRPCSTDMTMIPAHLGPVFIVQHSPFCHRVFVSCGADGHINVWADGIKAPLLTLSTSSGVVHCCWSPLHPTILASVSSNEVHIWDIARSCSDPMTTTRMRTHDQCYSVVRFSLSGTCLIVGDLYGHIRFYKLSQLPRTPLLKVEFLTAALNKSLQSNASLARQFKKLVKAATDDFTTKYLC